LNLENKFIVGHIGRFELQKNHEFLLDIFYEVYKRNKESILLLIGAGSLQDCIKQKVNKLALTDNVRFLGLLSNVSDFYQVMDCFVFPSLYEGLPLVIVEAQACGLPCFISDFLSYEATIVNSSKIPLDYGAKNWANCIIESTKHYIRADQTAKIREVGFDIKEIAYKMQKAYSK
jgi:glycosyltransferase involved in cell wall biosynthesis